MSSDGVVKFWDVRTKACVNEVKGLGDAFTLVWAPDGQSLIVGNKVSHISHLILTLLSSCHVSCNKREGVARLVFEGGKEANLRMLK